MGYKFEMYKVKRKTGRRIKRIRIAAFIKNRVVNIVGDKNRIK